MSLVINNKFQGLWQGSVDHKASSVINAIYDTTDPDNFALIGDAVFIQSPTNNEILPEVNVVVTSPQRLLFYGIIVGGDKEGIYPSTGDTVTFDLNSTELVALPGETVRVCTQGRCIARVATQVTFGAINVGNPLSPRSGGELIQSFSGEPVVARAVQDEPINPAAGVSFIAVDIHREGILP